MNITHVYRDSYHKLISIALRYTGNLQDAEDLVQEVSIKLSSKDLEEIDNLEGYFVRSIQNAGKNFIKSKASKVQPMELNDSIATYHDMRNKISSRDSLSIAAKSLTKLSSENRKIFIDHYVNNKSYSVISTETGINEKTLRTRVNYSKKIINKFLNISGS